MAVGLDKTAIGLDKTAIAFHESIGLAKTAIGLDEVAVGGPPADKFFIPGYWAATRHKILDNIKGSPLSASRQICSGRFPDEVAEAAP